MIQHSNFVSMDSNKDIILNISVNLARVSDWILSEKKQRRVDQFLEETKEFLLMLPVGGVSKRFQSTLLRFQKEFKQLLLERNSADKKDWAERALTWANILQHRAKLA